MAKIHFDNIHEGFIEAIDVMIEHYAGIREYGWSVAGAVYFFHEMGISAPIEAMTSEERALFEVIDLGHKYSGTDSSPKYTKLLQKLGGSGAIVAKVNDYLGRAFGKGTSLDFGNSVVKAPHSSIEDELQSSSDFMEGRQPPTPEELQAAGYGKPDVPLDFDVSVYDLAKQKIYETVNEALGANEFDAVRSRFEGPPTNEEIEARALGEIG